MKLRWGLLGPEMEAPGLWSRAPISQKGGSIANGPKLETRNGACPGVRYFAARYLDGLDANTSPGGVQGTGKKKKRCLPFRFLVNSSIPSLYNKTSRSPFPVLSFLLDLHHFTPLPHYTGFFTRVSFLAVFGAPTS